MSATGHCNGWTIIYADGEWRWSDTLRPITEQIAEHPCPRCGRSPTPEGYDACLGHIPGATAACCGHGIEDGTVQYPTKQTSLGRAPVGGWPPRRWPE